MGFLSVALSMAALAGVVVALLGSTATSSLGRAWSAAGSAGVVALTWAIAVGPAAISRLRSRERD